jgi:hypothetical protein
MVYAIVGGIALLGGFILWLYYTGKKAGATKVQNEVLVDTNEVKSKQLDAIVNGPKSKSDVMARLRDKGL